MEIISENKCHGGRQLVCRHASGTCHTDMTFGIYLPPQADRGPVPVLWYLSGLTCTHANAMEKSGLQRYASQEGLAVVFPDTSPRGESVADDADYDLGQGAGFYVNATKAPWSTHFRMYDYVVDELPELVLEHFPVDRRFGITGHSMGGHGALTIALRNPDTFTSVSAFAPIANPSRSDWGRKQLAAYLGDDEAQWAEHDASRLLDKLDWKVDMLVDQGSDDPFLDLLQPEALASAIASGRHGATHRMQPGYDHSYYFVSSFAEDHMRWHAQRLL